MKTPKSPKPLTTGPGNGNHSQNNHSHSHSHSQETQLPPHSAKSSGTGGGGGLKPTPKTPPVTPDSPSTYLDDDLDSLYSYTTTSGRSTMSCEHPYVAR